ncbi:hypothetical protein DPF_0936 [Desulfoplanes formicivorans]|uniref:HD domain-containing protein n=2 Tax=Desulfoplanes formicivorans TaxID=1592317 RepID=A0A194AFX5_9BACT|nr:hypothetical protein DPF_0936 [Desulfoplanes formicivorans]
MASNDSITFYRDFQKFYQASKTFFFTNPLVGRCKRDVLAYLHEDQDHCIQHAKQVAIDAGTLMLVEGRGWDPAQMRQWSLLAQIAGLLHDIHAPQSDHARTGAHVARTIIASYPLEEEEQEAIVFAVRHHEKPLSTTQTPCVCHWVSNALHDADKFHWSLDWMPTPLGETRPETRPWADQNTCCKVPADMETIRAMASTFRTRTGQQYGPQFINAGLATGEHLHQRPNDHILP